VYALGCDMTNAKAVERLCRIKQIKPSKAQFSFICYDLSHISDYTRPFNSRVFKVMKKAFPGPFTFILEANNNVPKIIHPKKKTVGIRIPDNNIIREIVRELDNPVITTSVKLEEDDIQPYPTNAELIYEEYEKIVDLVIDGGIGNPTPSTVIDCTTGEFEIVREGRGDIHQFL
jgi:tRNA threonylcarbamoyl adenosine modification protein (Sua5/YciO/YrdC/YwlC family)